MPSKAALLEKERVQTLAGFADAAQFFFEEEPTMDPKAVEKWFGEPHVKVLVEHLIKSLGGEPVVMKVLHSSPGLEDLWQLHFSQLSGQEYTVPGMFIANTVDDAPTTMPVAPMPTPQPGATAPTSMWRANC